MKNKKQKNMLVAVGGGNGGHYETSLCRQYAIKLLLSFSLFCFALLLAVIFRTVPRSFKAAAMLTSLLADMMLAHFRPFTDRVGGYSFTTGAVMFMAAHLLYITAFSILIFRSGKSVVNPGLFIGIAVTLGLMVSIYILSVRNPRDIGSMLILGLCYCLIIGTMFTAACTYAFLKKGFAFVGAVGAISFIISDMVIGLSKIGGMQIANSDSIIWFFYPLGQFLLLL